MSLEPESIARCLASQVKADTGWSIELAILLGIATRASHLLERVVAQSTPGKILAECVKSRSSYGMLL
jgi:hypothetical protein